MMLVVRNSKGDIYWMDIQAELTARQKSEGQIPRSVVFRQERFDALSIRRLREKMLRASGKWRL